MNRFGTQYILTLSILASVTLMTPLFAEEYEFQTICGIDIQIKSKDAPEPPQPERLPHQILGEIVVMGEPVAGVTLQADNNSGTCVTDEKGQFALEVPWGWSGSLTPSKAGWLFNPPCRSYENVRHDINERYVTELGIKHEWPPNIETEDETPFPEITADSPAWGRLAVTPMVLSLSGQPGQTVTSLVSIQNMGIQSPQIKISLADLQQQPNGPWQPVEAQTPQGSPRSCRSWLSLKGHQGLDHLLTMGKASCPVEVHIPLQARGFYSAALLVQPAHQTGVASPTHCSMVIPVLVEVTPERAETDVQISNIELLIPFSRDPNQGPRIRLTLDNRGETMNCFNAAVAAIPTGKLAHALGEPTMRFERQWIMPGAQLVLECDYVGPQPNQALNLRGTLDLIQESTWVKTVGSTVGVDASPSVPLTLTNDPTQTLAMLDYNAKQRIHMEPINGWSFDEFLGHCSLGLTTNFPARIQPVVREIIPDKATWSASAKPSSIQGPTQVQLTVKALNLDIPHIKAGQINFRVAQVGVLLIPEISNWQR